MAISAILTAAKLAASIASTPNVIPAPPPDITGKHRWMTITVVNQTQFALVPADSYFDSGRFWTAPTIVEPFAEMTFSVCNADTSFFTGVSGAVAFTVTLSPNLTCNIGVGFTNPEIGPFTSNVAFDADYNQPQDATPVLSLQSFTVGTYNNTVSTTVTTRSAVFSGSDTNNNATTIQFSGVSIPGQEAMVTITENIMSGGD